MPKIFILEIVVIDEHLHLNYSSTPARFALCARHDSSHFKVLPIVRSAQSYTWQHDNRS